jgi:hypothetical protein
MSSGIVALLLVKQIAHSTFKLPIQINEDRANVLHKTSLIIWDEVPM